MRDRSWSRRQVLCGLSTVAGVSLAGCLGASSDPAGDGGTLSEFAETQFRGGLRNQGQTGETIPPAVSQDWALPANESDHSATKGSPVITPDGDVLLADDTGRLRRITPEGAVRWEATITEVERGSHGTPAIVSGTAYIGSYDGAVSAFALETGDREWHSDVGSAVGASPTYYDGKLYVAVEHATPSGSVVVFDAGTGAIESWDEWPTDHPHSTVAIDREAGRLVCGSNDGRCYAWSFPGFEREWSYDTGGDVKTALAIADGVVIVPSWAGTVTAIDVDDGSQVWEFDGGQDFMCAPAVHDGTVYVGSHDSNIYALDLDTGKKEWVKETGGWITGNAVATPNHVLVGSYDRTLYALSQRDGSVTWSFSGRGEITSAPAVTADAIYVTERARNGESDYPGMLYRLTSG